MPTGNLAVQFVNKEQGMEPTCQGCMKITNEADIVKARKEVRNKSTELGFGITDVTRIVTATSELARNICRYAEEGIVYYDLHYKNGRNGIKVIFEDQGPGIDNIEKAMEIGFTTGEGLGIGLPGVKKLMDEMFIESFPGEGTRVTIIKWLCSDITRFKNEIGINPRRTNNDVVVLIKGKING